MTFLIITLYALHSKPTIFWRTFANCQSFSKVVSPLPYNNAIQATHHPHIKATSPLHAKGWPGGKGGRGEREYRQAKLAEGKPHRGERGAVYRPQQAQSAPSPPWEVVPLAGNLQSFAMSSISYTKSHFIITGKSHLPTNKRISKTNSQQHKRQPHGV